MKIAELTEVKEMPNTDEILEHVEQIKGFPETQNLIDAFNKFSDKIQDTYNVKPVFNEALNGLIGLLFLYIKIVLVVWIIYSLTGAISKFILYRRAGKSGFRALIPFVSLWTMTKTAGLPGFTMFLRLLIFVPFVGSIIYVVVDYYTKFRFAKSYGKTDLFSIFVIAVPVLGYLIMVFGNAKYTGKYYGGNMDITSNFASEEADIINSQNKNNNAKYENEKPESPLDAEDLNGIKNDFK